MGKIVNVSSESVTMGGVTVDRSRAVILHVSGTGAGVYTTMTKDGSAYQVPTGKTLKILAYRGTASSTTDQGGYVGYGDNVVTSTTAPTGNNTRTGGGAGFATILSFPSIATGRNPEGACYWTVPAGKYPYVYVNQATGYYATFLCIEE